jgi:hypothetical protein
MSDSRIPRLFASARFALLIAAIIVAVQTASKPPRSIYADELQYLTVSRNLVQHGVFSDHPVSETRPAPTAFFAPVTPLLYGLLLKADPALLETISCQMAHPADPQAHCRIAYSLFTRTVMGAFAVIGLWGSWILARSLRLSPAGAWVALAVVAASGRHAYFAAHFLTELPLLAIFPFFLALLVRATDAGTRTSDRIPFVALGLTMGLLALIRPSYVFQAYAVLAALPLLRRFRGAGDIGLSGWAPMLWAAAGYLMAVLPWMLRNAMTVGQFSLTAGYDGYILVQRLAYNHMTWSEWAMAWIYWLPDFGDKLATHLFGEPAVRRLSLDEPTGFYVTGNLPPGHPIHDKIPTSVFELLASLAKDFPKHVAVSLVMAWQGLWAGKYITFVALLLAPLALPVMAAAGLLRGFLVAAAPVVFMVGFNAFVSVSIPRYNLPMLWVSALIGAALLDAGIRRIKNRNSAIAKDTQR